MQIATTLDLSGDVLGNILRPAFGCVEGDYPDRLAIFSGQQILDDGLHRALQVCLHLALPLRPELSATK
ncbi:hypothetical protein RN69_20855 [Bradyrhizobium japonicum]|nr:hypothetical protein RN69_20855 [Bradyrhizobium japonicum]KMJ98294.1 hypothetical protein CF64_13935 [Bradyrhizobium japonicum]